ncbi:hypothetical protein [Streptomyces shenzhenensis]|uniref:hypothetical protein n=1 Tax=Streptomyces shenzhenensis TaxID=943815 RepID=UPI0015F0330A|nr:hypothetical protein [Streptomyces shenzhenensis]
MHAYDLSRHRPSFSAVPAPRAAQEAPGGLSATPIYDSLCAEWGKAFRTLPGDRSGEESLGFVAFGNTPFSTGTHGLGAYGGNSYSAYSAGAYSARNGGGQPPQPQPPQWQRVGTLGRNQESGMTPIPAALPPGPRRGL